MKKVLKNCQYFKNYQQNKFHAQLSSARKKFYNLGARSYLSPHCSHVSYTRPLFANVAVFKHLRFSCRFSERALSHFMDRSVSSDSAPIARALTDK